MNDLFNLLDVNGDETIDKKELSSLLTIFFRLLKENEIDVEIEEETDILF